MKRGGKSSDGVPRSSRGKTADRAGLAASLLVAALVFFLAGRDSSYLDIDSGPYLSMAHHTATSAVPRSSFLFLGGAERLPGLANYAPPLVGLLGGLASLLPSFAGGGDPLSGLRLVLFLSLLAAAFFSYRFLRAFASPAFAAAAAALLVASPALAPFAALALTELPFVALGLAGLVAAQHVLTDPRAARPWWGLAVVAAALPLTRWLGLYFLPSFLLAFSCFHGWAGVRARARRLLLVSLAGSAPVALWIALVASTGVPALPPRPPGVLGLGAALLSTGGHLLRWSAPFLAAGVVLAAVVLAGATLAARASGKPPAGEAAGPPWPGIALPAILLAGYLALTIAARVRNTYYPLEEIGVRFVAPAWPFAALALAALFHRGLWHRCTRAVNGLAAAAVLAGLGVELAAISRSSFPEPFPGGTATLEAALVALPDDAVVLANFGQGLVAHRPSLRVLGLPSRQDFRYSLDLPALAARHRLGWIVLFDLPGMSELYGESVSRWLREPPEGVRVRRRARLADGVIYELETERTTR